MSAPDARKTVCPRCGAHIDAHDAPCPYCGAQTHAEANRAAEQPSNGLIRPESISDRPPPPRDVAESRWAVLVLLFAALGPLAFPVLWRSPRFSRAWKLVLTIVVSIVTCVVVWLLWYATDRFVDALHEYGVIETR